MLPVTMPFEFHESMLPGDTRELRVYDEDLADLLDAADSYHGGLFAQLLSVPSADCSAAVDGCTLHSVPWTGVDEDYEPLLSCEETEQQEVAAWLPLLHVMEIRDPWQIYDWTEDDPILMWAEVRCIGRVMLQGDGHVVSLQASPDDEDIQTTVVAPYYDGALTETQGSEAVKLVLEIERLRRACFEREMMLHLRQGAGAANASSATSGSAASNRTETERRLDETVRRARAEPPAALGVSTLAERMNTLEAILQWQGLDAAPATSLEDLYTLWNVESEREGWLQLASYAACGWLRPAARMEGLQSRCTLERLELVCRELETEQKTLCAKLALQKLGKEQRET